MKRLYQQDDRSKLPPDLVERIAIILADRPSFRLHRLKGDLRGLWSVTVRANWRIVFRFEDAKAFDVDLLDVRKLARRAA